MSTETKVKRVAWNKGKGKGWTDKRGYQWVYVTEYGRRRAKREHRLVMEQHLGRRLEPWELVHHKDDNPQNNSINNLSLSTWGEHTIKHHTGSRRTNDAKQSMEVFANLREFLKRERIIKAELLEAAVIAAQILLKVPAAIENRQVDIGAKALDIYELLRAAVAKATN